MKRILRFIFYFLAPAIFILSFSFSSSQINPSNWWNTNSSSSTKDNNCVELNTSIPWIWKRICMWNSNSSSDENTTTVTPETAFPKLMGALTKLLLAVIIAVWFVMIILWGVLISSSWADQSLYGKGKSMIIKVIVWIALLWISWLILHMINPNFFK